MAALPAEPSLLLLAHEDSSSSSDDEDIDDMMKCKRQSSWLIEGHPRFLKDDAKSMLLEDLVSKVEEESDEEELDEEDMNYGLAPSYNDIDEEIREVEELLNVVTESSVSGSLDSNTAFPSSVDSKDGNVSRSMDTIRKLKSKRVRLLELPSHLKMVAKEHKRLLLEKQRRDLAVAAEAANAREESVVPARTQHTIRRGYLDRLGIASAEVEKAVAASVDMGIHARRAAIASAKTRRRPPSLQVQLRDPESRRGFFKKLAAWMASNEAEVPSVPVESTRKVAFVPVADVFFIPARSDYPHKVKATIWPTRQEFVEMVMRNMDQVEQEMQQEIETKRRIKDLRDNPPPSIKPIQASAPP